MHPPTLLLAAAGESIQVPLWGTLPFVVTLLGIAVLPLIAHHWWESNRNRAIFAWVIAVPTAIWWLTSYGETGWHKLLHEWEQYVSFIMLLGSLYVASGGIYLRGNLRGHPNTNSAICLIGAVIANIIGTTGASMLLIRPYMKANEHRSMFSRVLGVIFFIFMVSNVGGCLTPLGDPPLFLGFLNGVPFAWTLSLWKEWAVMIGLLLATFHVWDRIRYSREAPSLPVLEDDAQGARLGIEGKRNIFLLAGIMGAVLLQGILRPPFGVQEALMAAVAIVSMRITPREIRRKNRFTWGPILEVAILFSGIFTVMVPTLEILAENGDKLGLSHPWHFFWVTGSLSSFLDNAPTYVVFAQTGLAQQHFAADIAKPFAQLTRPGEPAQLLAAISLGAVFMGAMSYIGNGPNFMVKAIAEENGVEMPSFFGYMKYSIMILVPLFALITFIFLV